MYLSQLDLVGFKSFAQKTVVKFNDGITGVVGPNGCGKTNIVDAIRWVLGEQKSSTLRSDSMESVIFNGTKNRKPLGLAEVSMTIENSKGILPTEYSQVTITRRLFRNGDSQYLLNKTQCRLRDIVDLFLDTGMGAHAYSVIELKMVETILSTRMDDRRRLFEEAAGVTKYKIRRREAEGKLSAVQTDLTRLNDIVLEVQKSVRSLGRQAEKARKYKEIYEQIATLEKEILEREFTELSEKIHPLEARLHEIRSKKSDLETLLLSQEIAVADLESAQGEVETRLAESESVLSLANRTVADSSRDLAVAQERFSALKNTRERTIREHAELQNTIAYVEKALEETRAKHASVRERIQNAEREFAEKKAAYSVSLEQTQKLRNQARSVKDSVIQTMNSINALQSKTERNIARIESLKRRIEEIHHAIKTAEERVASIASEHEKELSRRGDFQDAISRTEKELQSAQEHQTKLRQDIDSSQSEIGEKQTEISRKAASLEFLTGLVDASESSSFLMKHSDWQAKEKRIILAEAINTDEQFRVALEASLGEAARYFVVETMQEAAAGIRALRDHEKGKATFICLEKTPELSAPSGDFSGRDGVFGWGSELVRAGDSLKYAVRALLGKTLVVDSLQTAFACIQEGLADCAVSLDGELVRSAGVLRGGGRKSTEGAMIGKREQIEQLKKEIAELQETLGLLRQIHTGKSNEYRAIDLRKYSDKIRQAEAEKNKHEQAISQLTYRRDSASSSINSQRLEREKFTREIAEIESSGGAALPEMDSLQEAKIAAEAALETVEKELRQAEYQLDADASHSHQAEMRVVQLTGEEKNILAELYRFQQQLESAKNRLVNRGKEREIAEQETALLSQKISEFEAALSHNRSAQALALTERNAVAEEQTLLRKRIHQETEQTKIRRKEFEEATNEQHATDLRISELRSRLEHSRRRAREEFEIELGQNPVQESMFSSLEEAREQSRKLKTQLQAFSAVNLLAFEEYEKESERLTFLEAQQKDLLESEGTLKQTIAEINENARKKFSETFEKIRTNFISIFKNLFDESDEVDLRVEEGDPLEASIEIIAKPRGKRPLSIDMLSGGEKTLTAIALLFAIYLVKPSPFCILDEVDAPLDDANISRYIKIIREFSKETQFIMITHNKRTMEAADTLYGVTMEEEGVSRIVSVEFRDGAKAA